ncbi:dienelactone hydrolase family protein [Rhodopirellula bahusiensis]|uniref:dienelactone hydrolase family protein n=1 Tax=Rhodopirellula bahusiensis TaxID=2014065 RepID=UPI0032662D08
MTQLKTISTTNCRIGTKRLKAILAVPENAAGLIVFAHGSDSSYTSPRNTHIAERLHRDGFATLLFDFLTETEACERDNSFKPPLLADRLNEVIDWTDQLDTIKSLPLGLFGSGTGMTAVMIAAANPRKPLHAIVSRGGRVDLVSPWLGQVNAPTLFIVGERDKSLVSPNQNATQTVKGVSKLVTINGASHLFSETGKLDEVAELAAAWFTTHLQSLAAGSVPR